MILTENNSTGGLGGALGVFFDLSLLIRLFDDFKSFVLCLYVIEKKEGVQLYNGWDLGKVIMLKRAQKYAFLNTLLSVIVQVKARINEEIILKKIINRSCTNDRHKNGMGRCALGDFKLWKDSIKVTGQGLNLMPWPCKLVSKRCTDE